MFYLLDQHVLSFFAAHRLDWLTYLALIITYSGGYLVASIVSLLSIASFYLHRQTANILALLSSLASSTILVFGIKNIIDRARPLEAFYTESFGALPSGHAAIAIALYGFLLVVSSRHDKHRLRNPLIYFLGILILAIGLSRLYLGVHYLSDILAGYLIGAICLRLALFLFPATSKSKA